MDLTVDETGSIPPGEENTMLPSIKTPGIFSVVIQLYRVSYYLVILEVYNQQMKSGSHY